MTLFFCTGVVLDGVSDEAFWIWILALEYLYLIKVPYIYLHLSLKSHIGILSISTKLPHYIISCYSLSPFPVTSSHPSLFLHFLLFDLFI